MFRLDKIVPWGRSYDEYRRMFALTDADLASSILGCADGPASFNVEATRRGTRVVSCDPLYRFDAADIRTRIGETYTEILEQTRRNQDEFVWDAIRSVDELGAIRMRAMEDFLADYDPGRSEARYVDAELPQLPFSDARFDLAVCSHFLFLYTGQLTASFHRDAVLELCRVAREVRIFPLLALGAQPSPYVQPVAAWCEERGFAVSIERVPYEFQRGGNEMMRIRKEKASPGFPSEAE
jgi:hypothetical protein